MIKRRTLSVAALAPLAILAAGCATPTPDVRATPDDSQRPITSFSATDPLGQVLFAGPVADASPQAPSRASFAEAQGH